MKTTIIALAVSVPSFGAAWLICAAIMADRIKRAAHDAYETGRAQGWLERNEELHRREMQRRNKWGRFRPKAELPNPPGAKVRG